MHPNMNSVQAQPSSVLCRKSTEHFTDLVGASVDRVAGSRAFHVVPAFMIIMSKIIEK